MHARSDSTTRVGAAPLLTSPSLNDEYGVALGESGLKPRAKVSVWNAEVIGTQLTLINSALGAGVLDYPYAYMNGGLAVASLVTLMFGTLSFTALISVMHVMVTAQNNGQPLKSYGDLVHYGLGKRAAKGIEVLIVLYAFGACVGYLVLLGDLLTPLSDVLKLGVSDDLARTVMSCIAAGLCWLLSLLRRISALRYSAVVAVIATFFMVAVLVYQAAVNPCRPGHCDDEHKTKGVPDPRKGWPAGGEGVSLWPQGVGGFLRSLPLIVFALQCQIQCTMIHGELSAPVRESIACRRAIAFGAVAGVLFLYFPTGICGFLRFGLATQDDILKNFDVADEFADIARLCITVCALGAFPLQHFPARVAMNNWMMILIYGAAEDAQFAPPSLRFVFIEATAWTGLVLFIAIKVGSNLGDVFTLIGAMAGSIVILIIPGLLWAKMGKGSKRSATRILPAAALLLVGAFIFVTGTGVTLLKMIHPSNATAVASLW